MSTEIGSAERPCSPQLRPLRRLGPEVDLEQRVVARVTLRSQNLDDLVERQILVGVGAEGGLLGAADHLPKRGVAGQLRPQRDRVGEEADQPLQLDVVAVGDRTPDHDVLLAADPVQEGREGGQHDHEEGHALLAPKLQQRLGQSPRERDRVVGSVVSLHRPAGPVGRQRQQRRGTLELVGPVRREIVEQRATQALALPHRVVGVLDRQLGQLRRPTGQLGVVELAQLGEQDAVGVGVGGDVVHPDQQHVVLGAELEQRRAQHQVGGQVERFPGELAQAPGQLLSLFRSAAVDVEHGNGERPRLEHGLGGLSLRVDDGAEALVPLDHGPQPALERIPVQRPTQSERPGAVERRRVRLPLL